jgi:hypothetical protein
MATTELTVRITPNDKGNPPGKLADAKLHFIGGALDGLKLIGFCVWERRGGSGRPLFPRSRRNRSPGWFYPRAPQGSGGPNECESICSPRPHCTPKSPDGPQAVRAPAPGVPEVWIESLENDELLVHRNPVGDAYMTSLTLRSGDSVAHASNSRNPRSRSKKPPGLASRRAPEEFRFVGYP